jgi:hypothetical protein
MNSPQGHADARRSWRDDLTVHPAADPFPPIPADEIKEFAADFISMPSRHDWHASA